MSKFSTPSSQPQQIRASHTRPHTNTLERLEARLALQQITHKLALGASVSLFLFLSSPFSMFFFFLRQKQEMVLMHSVLGGE